MVHTSRPQQYNAIRGKNHENTRKKLVLLLVLCVISSQDANAQKNSKQRLQEQASIFAYPGECPSGSTSYTGPGIADAAKQGISYCSFTPKARVIQITEDRKTCPPMMKAYTAQGETPADGFIWCENDSEFKVPPPPPLDQLFGPNGKPIPKNAKPQRLETR